MNNNPLETFFERILDDEEKKILSLIFRNYDNKKIIEELLNLELEKGNSND